MKGKYYHLQFEELNGEQEYTHDSLIHAEGMEAAQGIAECVMRTWYDDGNVEEIELGKQWDFFCGQLIVTFKFLQETTREQFAEHLINLRLVRQKGVEG